MSDFKTRLIEENNQLKDKLVKLEEFLSKENFTKITPIQQSLLRVQRDVMESYCTVLGQRIINLD